MLIYNWLLVLNLKLYSLLEAVLIQPGPRNRKTNKICNTLAHVYLFQKNKANSREKLHLKLLIALNQQRESYTNILQETQEQQSQ